MEKNAESRYLEFILTHAKPLSDQFYMQIELGGVYLGEGGFLILLIDPGSYQEIDRHTAACSTLIQLLNQELEHKALHYTGFFNSYVTCLIALPRILSDGEAAEQAIANAKSALINVQRKFHEQDHEPVQAIVSNIIFGTDRIPIVYTEAIDHLKYRNFMELPKEVIALSETFGSSQTQMDENFFFADRTAKITQLLFQGNTKDAYLQLKLAVEYCTLSYPCFLPNMRLRLITLFNHLSCALIRQNHITRDFLQKCDILAEVNIAATRSELERAISDFWTSLLGQLSCIASQPNLQWIHDIEEYIELHSEDPNLSVNQLADHYAMTQPTLSNRYKKFSGRSLTDEIHKVRIHHAKKLLTSTSLSMNQIAEAVGYGSTITMTRAFQKYEGISPRQLRIPL